MSGVACEHRMTYVPGSEPWANRCEKCGLVVEFPAAERVVARLDTYSQEQHARGIEFARGRADARRAARRGRAENAAERLRLGGERVIDGWCPAPSEAPIDHSLLIRGCSACGWTRKDSSSA